MPTERNDAERQYVLMERSTELSDEEQKVKEGREECKVQKERIERSKELSAGEKENALKVKKAEKEEQKYEMVEGGGEQTRQQGKALSKRENKQRRKTPPVKTEKGRNKC
jgi:hypothetical protein